MEQGRLQGGGNQQDGFLSLAPQCSGTAKSGRFLEFLESLKRPGRSSMSRTSPSSNGPRPERVPTGMRYHADAGVASDRSNLKPPWLTASGQTTIFLHPPGEGGGIHSRSIPIFFSAANSSQARGGKAHPSTGESTPRPGPEFPNPPTG